jgi:hypothetical protein
MRRLLPIAILATGLVLIASPAQAFAHNRVTNPYLHTLVDLLTVAVVLSPVVTVYRWGPHRKTLLLALITVVQIPVAIIGFVPILHPTLHLTLFVTALGLTAVSIRLVRRATRTHTATLTAPPH